MLPSKRHKPAHAVRATLKHAEASGNVWTKRVELPPAVEGKPGRQTVVGTLSFPVLKTMALRDNDNADIIAEIIRRRRPELLLCAGWSVSSPRKLSPVENATRTTRTIVVLEACMIERGNCKKPISFKIKNGQRFEMGKQVFAESKETTPRRLSDLSRALPDRSFRFSDRDVVLLVCGEVMVVGKSRGKVHFRHGAPQELKKAVHAEGVLVLNPTHTRMGRPGLLNAWRRFLSEKGRVYLSASNWRTSKDKKSGRRQWPSSSLHSLWYDGKLRKATELSSRWKCDQYCYREWELP